ncbi:MAG: hypothetical protein NC110_06865 [Ruminococcus sp.]|nr:hypothetical protein [Ruminococcus sp.]
MEQKKIIQIISILIAALWVFCIVTVISVKVAQKNQPEAVTLPDLTTSAPATAFTPATTSEPVTEEQEVPTMHGNNVTTAAQVDDPQWLVEQKESEKVSQAEANIPKGKAQIVGAYLTAVNNLKEEKRFTLTKTDNLSVSIDEMNPGYIQSIANKIISSNTNTAPVTYRFVNGMDAANSSDAKSPNQVIAPISQTASVDDSLIKSATVKSDSNGSYTLTIKLGKQVQTLTEPAKGYSTLMQIIETDEFLPSNATIDSMNITYDNGTIEATIDKDGRITSMKHSLEVTESNGSGTYLTRPVTLKMHGSHTADYQISY